MGLGGCGCRAVFSNHAAMRGGRGKELLEKHQPKGYERVAKVCWPTPCLSQGGAASVGHCWRVRGICMINSCLLKGGRALLAPDCGGHQQAKCKGSFGQAGPQLPTRRKATFWQSEATTAVRLLPCHQEEPPQEGPVSQGRSEPLLQAPDSPFPMPTPGMAIRGRQRPPVSILSRTQIGEFYETMGTDAVLLVEFAGLNPMGNRDTPTAGCPVCNIRRTLHDLVKEAGLSVVRTT